jgi:hypothetical protein
VSVLLVTAPHPSPLPKGEGATTRQRAGSRDGQGFSSEKRERLVLQDT